MAAPNMVNVEIRPGRSPESSEMDEEELVWEAIQRLPSQKRSNYVILPTTNPNAPVDIRKLDREGRKMLVDKAFATSEQDNYNILSGIKQRLQNVGMEVPNKVEVHFQDLTVTADVHVGGRALPTLPNYVLDVLDGLVGLRRSNRHKLTILNNLSGCIRPGRMTLLLGPPGSGKSTLLRALAGKLDSTLKKSGQVTYNGVGLEEFAVHSTSAYISQTDNHIGELTVRETLDFAATCQRSTHKFAKYLKNLSRLEKEKNIRPTSEIDAFMKGLSVKGGGDEQKHSLATDYVLKVLGLDVCADTLVGSDMVRGVSGGQRKRVTTGEMVVGPRKTLFMDEISTGLDSSTTYQIIKCTRNFVHQMDATVLISLLQPPPETFQLFDDLILLSEGHIVYQGPTHHALPFFQSLGFALPPRKALADFLQEVTSEKDQGQYWAADDSKPYAFIPVPAMVEEFNRNSEYGRWRRPDDHETKKNMGFNDDGPERSKYAVSMWVLLKACFDRELLLISRHRFLYIFRTIQVALVGFITSTLFLRTRIHPTDEANANLYMSCLFFGLVHMMFNGFSELPITISRLPVFYKQRDNSFHPAWTFTLPSWLLRLPYSVLESVVWSCVVYYTVGFAPGPGSFFRFMFLLFTVHQMALGLFRMMGAIARDMVIANTFGSAAILAIFLLGGFIVPKHRIKPWWSWAFWVSPLSYAQRAISVNEFTATRWMHNSTSLFVVDSNNNNVTTSVGHNVLRQLNLPTDDSWYWIGVAVLLAYSFLFNILFNIALARLNPLGKASATVPSEDESAKKNGLQEGVEKKTEKRGMILPFRPLSMTFHQVNYFVDMPKEMSAKGIPEKRLQLLSGVSGVFRPGVLTALVGSSGAGKTTLMDVLAGRKTGGYIEGDVRICGFPKEQSTFARICGYVEQNDIHSPQVTVEESLWFSSSLRLPSDVSPQTRHMFVEEVMSLVELDTLRYALVGLPGSTGLSTEQRKRLTIAVELVANPSIIFMDEPTSGLDARAAAIVMRAVRNTVDTGRTVVCTIHQPSIDIFETFDELLLMKRGGRVIYGGSLGMHSQKMISYFQSIDGIDGIPDGYNPATWMLEVTTQAAEARVGRDFADIYKSSECFREVEGLIQELSVPETGTEPLSFSTKYSQNSWTQFRVCLRKQNLVYWRSPFYNVVRLFFTTFSALIFGSIFWNVGSKRETTQDLFLVMGALYSAALFLGVNNSTTVQPVVSVERTVFYRERAAGLYSPFPYAMAQGLVEIPYILAQTVIYGCVTYFMINFERTTEKFFMYLVFMFLTFTYFTFYGMMAIGLTPTQHLAAVVSSAFYSVWNLFAGFLLPKPNIPGWWIWFYYACPLAWTIRGIITSQLGDVETQLVGLGFQGTVKDYIEQQLGFESGMTGVSVLVLIAFSLLFFAVYAMSIKVLNFQHR